jgi:hypothetical protein
VRLLALLFLTLLAAAPAFGAEELAKKDLTVWMANGQSHRFEVEVAVTPAEQEVGLMFRKSMPEDSGMIFLNKIDKESTFWMKNTYIPLDMLFVARDGKIIHIKANAKPLSEDFIPSGGPVRAIIELNGGTAARLGIKAGDHVVFPGLGSPG